MTNDNKRKLDILIKLRELENHGVVLHKTFTMDDSLEELEIEMEYMVQLNKKIIEDQYFLNFLIVMLK